MGLAIFDLDNTLIGGDSDHAWGEYLVQRGCVDGELFRSENDRFYREYQRGKLDIRAYLEFALEPLARIPRAELEALHADFMREVISDFWLPRAEELVQGHRERGHHTMIITATNHFVVHPIAQKLGVDSLLATDPEKLDGAYTGRVEGTPCFREGKVQRLQAWLQQHPQFSAVEHWFYSDSANDLPLLDQVTYPVAVDPDDDLRQAAGERGWPIISLRDG
ncbi:HAD family hydrolase [Biformimicrobium ophioploci]|uniref:HAD family hydrolase n=1 Tax=Biformimicrobium ophioploci TaxID=3036711 RepID=A0ABQ6M0H4_9GAMM|nr:HAD family hydrolase [Microbulbifer sp. NKW57]GMG87850.1 HAD family hydrolase [Microbulbifer sp. NKW57]